MRRWLLGCLLAPASATAQVPDVRVRVDATLNYRTESRGPTSLRFYNTMGRHSTVGIWFFLEPGFRAYASQRLQRIPGDVDGGLIDEVYVEDEGIWRLGKQYLPFGSEEILRESVQAARADTSLIFEGLPIRIAACDNGPNLQRGFVGRVGSRVGFSFAVGRHFGIAATALNHVRRPEASPGAGRGYRHVFGMDASQKSGFATFKGEVVVLRVGESASDADRQIYDSSVAIQPSRYRTFLLGWSRSMPDRTDYYRVMASVYVLPGLTFEPMLRYRNSRFYDISLALRARF